MNAKTNTATNFALFCEGVGCDAEAVGFNETDTALYAYCWECAVDEGLCNQSGDPLGCASFKPFADKLLCGHHVGACATDHYGFNYCRKCETDNSGCVIPMRVASKAYRIINFDGGHEGYVFSVRNLAHVYRSNPRAARHVTSWVYGNILTDTASMKAAKSMGIGRNGTYVVQSAITKG